jgi:hypothetical protein
MNLNGCARFECVVSPYFPPIRHTRYYLESRFRAPEVFPRYDAEPIPVPAAKRADVYSLGLTLQAMLRVFGSGGDEEDADKDDDEKDEEHEERTNISFEAKAGSSDSHSRGSPSSFGRGSPYSPPPKVSLGDYRASSVSLTRSSAGPSRTFSEAGFEASRTDMRPSHGLLPGSSKSQFSYARRHLVRKAGEEAEEYFDAEKDPEKGENDDTEEHPAEEHQQRAELSAVRTSVVPPRIVTCFDNVNIDV